MANWYEGEVLPAGKDWIDAPADIAECEHERGVVIPVTQFDNLPANSRGKVCLHCMVCDMSWWEPIGNIKGSPWEGR